MEEEEITQNVSSSGKKKKKKKKKKNRQDQQDESTHKFNLDAADASLLPTNLGPFRLRDDEGNSVSQYTGAETSISSDIPVNDTQEPVVKQLEDDAISKVKVAMSASVVGNVSTTLEEKSPEKKKIVGKEELSKKEAENKNPAWSLPAPNEVKSSSPGSVQKKKKKKADGYLLSDALNSLNSSDKKRSDANKPAVADLKRFTEDRWLLQTETRERVNIHKIDMLVNKVGLDALRRLFTEIHPTWTNKPGDAKKLQKGKMILKGHDLANFNNGDINKWDVSLITTVLLHSTKCFKEISKKKGFEDAIREIKSQKNQLISHKKSEKMTDDDFQQAWSTVSKCLVNIGADIKEIDDIFTDSVYEHAKFHRDMHLEELSANENQLQTINAKFANLGDEVASKVAEKLVNAKASSKDESQANGFQDQSGPKWDEWLIFCENVQNFNYLRNNYILITDAMSIEDLENFSVLRSVPWKIVLDFDPDSEEHGMYHDFVTKENKKSLIDMYTPAEIGRHHASTINLARSIDARKTQWMFVNGREKDNLASGIQTVEEWKRHSVKHINSFLRCCSDPERLDKHKPIICVILPFQKETAPYFKVAMKRLVENFDEFDLTFVGVEHQHIHQFTERFDIHLTGLSSDHFSHGLKDLLEVSPGKEYRIPSCQAKLPVNLTSNQYLYLQEYLDVLYIGCEDLPPHEYWEENKLNKILNEHRESFLSGNSISFVSLYDNHDAKRELGGEIQIHIQRLVDKGPNVSTIVEIRHLPGTGGTTIARRVLWELHKYYPCAIARLEDCKYDFEEDLNFVQALADRIRTMHEICQTIPVVLLDGKHATIEALGNKLVRMLNSKGQRAVLLSCLHRSTKGDGSYQSKPNPNVHRRFFVQVKLEDSVADKNEFEAKYKDYIDQMEDTTRCRVFHFPLLAMLKGLKGFDSKLTKIINDSFDDMQGLQKEIAAVVAFIQHYAAQPTPAPLVYKAFQEFAGNYETQRITYEDINRQLITEHLLNLMVPAKPSRNRQTTQSSQESYTFQHPLIADMVLKRYFETQRSDVLMLTKQFLEFPIIEDDQFFVLVNDLFIRRRSSRKERHSILFEELKRMDVQEAAALFCRLAEKTGNAIVFAHAARFHANNHPPFFQTATSLIAKAFTCKNAQPKIRIINDMKGGILHTQLKFMVESRKVESLEKLEHLADEALQSFRSARTWPPTFPSPLTGEVKVWITCIEWITRYQCNADTDKAFEFINSTAAPAFFRNCITDSFRLLDVVDDMIKNEPSLPEPEETRELVDSLKMSLLKTFNKNSGSRRGKDRSLIQICRNICSRDKFPKCSQTQLMRLQVHYILSEVESIESMKKEDLEFLLSLLEYLVLGSTGSGDGNTYMARYLMNVALHIKGAKLYSLERGLQVAEIWMQESGYNPDPYFYKMMVNFIKIIDGNQIMCRDSYINALEKCKDMSENSCRKFLSSHFLKKDGEGMNRLITRNALLSREPELSQNKDSFWTTRSRKTLLECCGRIRIRPKSGKRNPVYIELVNGNVEIYLGKNADIGNVGRDFPKGKLVYFVVSFNLDGPVANGVTFEPTSHDM